MAEDIKVILFDLGGVLIDFVGLTEIARHIPEQLTNDELRSRWIASQSNAAFERGEMLPDAFAEAFCNEWDILLQPEQLKNEFQNWITGPLPGAVELLDELRPRYRLACLSNTNALHWETLLHTYGLKQSLDDHFASHILGLIKPDLEIYRTVCTHLNALPEQVVFFDDGLANVEAAKQIGMTAYQVNGPAEIQAKLVEVGLLD